MRGSLRAQIHGRLSHLLRIRSQQACFSPQASQKILEGPAGAFVLLREVGRYGEGRPVRP